MAADSHILLMRNTLDFCSHIQLREANTKQKYTSEGITFKLPQTKIHYFRLDPNCHHHQGQDFSLWPIPQTHYRESFHHHLYLLHSIAVKD